MADGGPYMMEIIDHEDAAQCEMFYEQQCGSALKAMSARANWLIKHPKAFRDAFFCGQVKS